MSDNKTDDVDLDLDLDIDLDLDVTVDEEENDLVLDLDIGIDNFATEDNSSSPQKEEVSEEPVDELDLDLDLDVVVKDLDLDISFEEAPGFNPFEGIYSYIDEDEEIEPIVEEEVEKLDPKDYVVEIVKDLVQFRGSNVLGGKTFSSSLSTKIKVLLAKIVRERGFDMKESTSVSEMIISMEVSNSYEPSRIIEDFKSRFNPEPSKLKSLTYSLESIRNSYRRMISEEKLREERVQAPKKSLETQFYLTVDDVLRAYYEYSTKELPISYLKEITFSAEDGYKFTCGGCGETIGLKSSPIEMLVYPTDRKLKVLQKPIICRCDTLNIIRKPVYQSIENSIKSYYKHNVASWSEKDLKLSSILNFFKYEPKLQMLGGDGNIKVESQDFTEQDEEESFESLKQKMDSRYKDTIKIAKNLHKINYASEDPVEGDDSIVVDNSLKIYKDVAKYLCLLSKEKYSNLTRMAKGSLYMHLKETPSVFYSLYEKNPRIIALEESEKLFNKGNISPELKDRISRSLGVFGDVTDDDIRKGFEDLKLEIAQGEEDRTYILDNLERAIPFFMLIPIRNFSYSGELRDITADPFIKGWVDKVINLMIISHLIPNFYSLWGNKRYGKSKNDTMFNDKREPWDSRVRAFSKECMSLGFIKRSTVLEGMIGSLADSTGSSMIKESVNIKNAIKKLDYVTFMDRIALITKTHGSFISYLHDKFHDHTVSAHKLFFNFKDENKEFNYYNFYYGKQFSEKEIKEGIIELSGERVAPIYEVVRKEGEGFAEFIYRVKSINGERPSLNQSEHNKFFSKLTKLSFNLSALTAISYYKELHGQDSFKRFAFLCETIVRFPNFNLDTIYNYLGLPVPSSAIINSVEEEREQLVNSSKFLDSLIENVIFEDEGLNSFRDTNIDSPNLYYLLKEEEGLEGLIDSLSYSELLGELLS